MKLAVAGVASAFPAVSTARTENVCLPFFALSFSGEVQGENDALSSAPGLIA